MAVYVQGLYFKAKLTIVVIGRPRGMETLSALLFPFGESTGDRRIPLTNGLQC